MHTFFCGRYEVMSYAPAVEKTIRDEANHQLAYGGQAQVVDQQIMTDEIGRTAIFDGDTAALATECGVILGHNTGNIFMRFATNGHNHLDMGAMDKNDSLSMPEIKHDKNGMAVMVDNKEKSDIVRSIAISNIRNDTNMDIELRLPSVQAAGTASFVHGSSTVGDIIVAGTNCDKKKVLYELALEEDVSEFAAQYLGSTASSIEGDVQFQQNSAAVRLGSPILHFHDTHEVDGKLRNTHSSELPTESHFGHPHVIMPRETAKMYLEKTQQILNRFLAHADVCSKRFAIQVRRLQKNLPAPAEGTKGRLSFDIDIEYVNTSSH